MTSTLRIDRRPLLGEVTPCGSVVFAGTVAECRLFLRSMGLECDHAGWRSAGWRGAIDYHEGEYFAVASRR